MRTEQHRAAESCLVSVAAVLSMTVVRNDNFPMWLEILRRLAPFVDDCPAAMRGLRDRAIELAFATPGREQEAVLLRLRSEVRAYFQAAAGQRLKVVEGAGSRV